MATWVRNNTGTLPSATDANVTGTVELGNATAPGDFDPTAVSSVRIQATVAKTAGSIVDDIWQAFAVGVSDFHLTLNGNGTAIATVSTTQAQITDGTPSRSIDLTDSTIGTGFSTAQWEGAEVNPDGADMWASFTSSKMADGVTVAVTAVTVTITYTPLVTISPLLGLRMPQSIVHRM